VLCVVIFNSLRAQYCSARGQKEEKGLIFFFTSFKAFKQLIISSATLGMKSCSAVVFNSLQACRTARQQSRHCAAPGTNAIPFIHKLNSLLSYFFMLQVAHHCESICLTDGQRHHHHAIDLVNLLTIHRIPLLWYPWKNFVVLRPVMTLTTIRCSCAALTCSV
jgi:hypothetical protein